MKVICIFGAYLGNAAFVEILVANGADINAQGRIGEKDSPLYKAVARGIHSIKFDFLHFFNFDKKLLSICISIDSSFRSCGSSKNTHQKRL